MNRLGPVRRPSEWEMGALTGGSMLISGISGLEYPLFLLPSQPNGDSGCSSGVLTCVCLFLSVSLFLLRLGYNEDVDMVEVRPLYVILELLEDARYV